MSDLYDNEYTGERWTYGLRNRPLASSHVPRGWIFHSDRPHPDFPLYGTVDYPRELDQIEVDRYELTLTGPNAAQAQARQEADAAEKLCDAIIEASRQMRALIQMWPANKERTDDINDARHHLSKAYSTVSRIGKAAVERSAAGSRQ